MTGSSFVRVVLGLKAASSLAAGILLLLVPDSVSQILFADPGGWKAAVPRGLGLGLVIFALALAALSANPSLRKGAVIAVSLADLGWLLGSALLVLGFGGLLMPKGAVIVVVVAAVVALFATGQLLAVRGMVTPLSRVSLSRKGRMLSFRVSREVTAPASRVWEVMTDHPGYAEVARNIAKVEVVSGDGLGMQRRCYGPKAENWLETCNHFDAGRAFGFRVHTEAADYPYPIAALTGLWAVEPREAGSEFSIQIEATPTGGWLARTLFSLLAGGKFKAVLVDLAEAWAARMETPLRGAVLSDGRFLEPEAGRASMSAAEITRGP